MRRQKLPKTGISGCKRLILGAWLIILAAGLPAWAAEAGRDFSFTVMGDSRGHYYLPGEKAQEGIMRKILAGRSNPQPVKLFFNQTTGQLERAVFEATERKPYFEVFYQDGWPWLIRRRIKGQMRVVMRDAGRRWVFDRVVESFKRGALKEGERPVLAIHTGDAVVWGGQGRDLNHSPYWQRFRKEFVDRLPAVEAGSSLPGRVFMALGNHDIRKDPEIKGVMGVMPYLARLGFSPQNRSYTFTYGGSRFIFLDTGTQVKGRYWAQCRPDFKTQMTRLTNWLKQAVSEKARHVFVVFHAPAFCQAGHQGLPLDMNPHQVLKSFADRLAITVFNGHAHTTELYLVDGVRYWVLGGGGAPQVLETLSKRPGQPPELYWAGRPRQEEYNYLLVKVRGPRLQAWIHRFRPEQTQAPVSRVAVAVMP